MKFRFSDFELLVCLGFYGGFVEFDGRVFEEVGVEGCRVLFMRSDESIW